MESRDSSIGTTMSTTDRGDVQSKMGAEFEVFLNFRGPDTRLNFADCLYHSMDGAGIRVFRDNEEIRKGEAIGGELERAIKSSTICMPIFSRNYASSAWCLRELAYMVDWLRNRGGKAMILPIFFDVNPDDVKLKTGLYHEALQKHKEKFDCDVVQQWKEALIEVARMKGWHPQDSGHGELIKSIVADVLIKLNKRDKNLPDDLVGIQDRVDDVMRLLDEGSLDVRYLVIHGMGGIGKTTLAKVVFNQISSRFYGCSFLSDVREASKGGKVIQLQKQLLSEILNFTPMEIFDSDVGINQIKRRFRDKKVLIVLDDLDKWEQLSKLAGKLDWFGLGSRIIITTRDTNFLPIDDENRETHVQTPFEEFKIYQMEVLHHGHALQLFCRRAFRMDSPPHDYVDISHDIIGKVDGLPLALEVIGSSLYRKSKRLWKDTLKKLSLVPYQDVLHKLKISFEMLENAQREIFLDIACYFIGEERIHPHYMWKALDYFPRSEIIVLTRMSLIKIDDFDELLMHDLVRDLGREIVQQEDLKFPEKRSRLWCPKIALDIVQTRKGTENIIALKLTGLSKEHDFTSEEFSRLPSLRFLDLEGGNFIGDFKNLLSSLRWLSWRHCPSDLQVVNLHLYNLVVLKLSDSDIPENWNGWGPCLANCDLKVIHLKRCHLSTTPDFSTCLNLKILVFYQHRPKLLQISKSISKLKHLKRFEITLAQGQLSKLPASDPFNQFIVPSTICNLKYLSSLKLEGQCIQELHPSIGEMGGLTSLTLADCHCLRKLPDSIGRLRSLLSLNLFGTKIEELPDSIGDLKRLEKMNLGCTQIRKLPNSIGGLESLLDLNLVGTKINKLPTFIGYLKRLKRFFMYEETNLGSTQTKEQPFPMEVLMSWLFIHLHHWFPKELPASVGQLIRQECFIVKNLTVMESGGCRNITWPPQLEELGISCNDPRSLTRFPYGLRLLELRDVKSPIGKPLFSNLRYLSNLILFRCWLREIEFEHLENLFCLKMEECESLVRLLGLSSLRKLEVLSVNRCSQITEIRDLGELQSLKQLSIENCSSMERLPDLSKLRELQTVHLHSCESLKSLPDISNTCHIYFSECPMLGHCQY